jgi:hypothetical protein
MDRWTIRRTNAAPTEKNTKRAPHAALPPVDRRAAPLLRTSMERGRSGETASVTASTGGVGQKRTWPASPSPVAIAAGACLHLGLSAGKKARFRRPTERSSILLSGFSCLGKGGGTVGREGGDAFAVQETATVGRAAPFWAAVEPCGQACWIACLEALGPARIAVWSCKRGSIRRPRQKECGSFMRRGDSLLPVMWLSPQRLPTEYGLRRHELGPWKPSKRRGAKKSENSSWLQLGELAARNSRHCEKLHRLIEPLRPWRS